MAIEAIKAVKAIRNPLLFFVMCSLSMFGCAGGGLSGGSTSSTNSSSSEAGTSASAETGAGDAPALETETNSKGNKNPLVTVTMSDGKIMYLELYPDVAPNSVNNFISLINKGQYDGTIFHRVIPGFMIQGGDPLGTGSGGPGYNIAGEFSNNGHKNDLAHSRGVLSMARRGHPTDPASAYDTAGSQFFIMVEDSPYLDSDYAAFGKLLGGQEVADAIVAVERDQFDKPLVDQKIETMTVDTFGVEYPEPETIEEQ